MRKLLIKLLMRLLNWKEKEFVIEMNQDGVPTGTMYIRYSGNLSWSYYPADKPKPESIEAQLSQALAREDYEEAARLRDIINTKTK